MTDTVQQELAVYEPSVNLALSGALMGLDHALERAAQQNLDTLRQEIGDDQFSMMTEAEKIAIVAVDKLKLVNGMDLAALLMRARYLDEIEAGMLWQRHPSGYGSFDEMARDVGLSGSMLSDIRQLVRVVFPYIERELHLPVAYVWENVGKSNFRTILPILASVITGEENQSALVRNFVDDILDDTAATLAAAGQPRDDANVRRHAVETLLEHGRNMTNRELTAAIRPSRTSFNAAALRDRDEIMCVVQMNSDEWEAFQRKLGSALNASLVDLPADPGARRNEASRIPQVRRIYRLLE